MAWIGYCEARKNSRASSVIINPMQSASTQNTPLLSGSLVIEARLSSEPIVQSLLEFEGQSPLPYRVAIQIIPNGGVVMLCSLKGEVRQAMVPHTNTGRTDLLRVTYSWDMVRRSAIIAVENPQMGTIEVTSAPVIPEFFAEILRYGFGKIDFDKLNANHVYIALSDAKEPIGPMPGLLGNVPIETPFGPRPISQLREGDVIVTPGGAHVPILAKVARTVPARGTFRPVRLRAPYMGLTSDMIVAPDQKMVIGGSLVEYMFGAEAVLTPAEHLVNGLAAQHDDRADFITYHQILLPRHEAMIAAGTAMDSLYIGRMRRKPEIYENSLLAKIPRDKLPEHAKSVYPVLMPFEAIALSEQRAA